MRLHENAFKSIRVDRSLRPNEKESGREFKLFESARDSIKAHESLRPNESEGGLRVQTL